VSGPSWLAGGLAVVMIATAVYCVSRLVAAWRWRRPTEYDVDGVHVLMGVGMAGMLVPRLNSAAGSGWDIGGAAVFGAAMAWFGWRAIQGYRGGRAGPHAVAHHGQHVLASGAMLYMFLALPSAGAGGLAAGTAMAATGARIPTFALLLALGLFGYVIWTTDRLSSLAPATVTVMASGRAPVSAALSGPASVSITSSGQAPVSATRSGPAPVSIAQPGRVPVSAGPAMSPRLAACCEILMGVAMGYMLITML
jgi:hypothetical protein